MLTRATIDGIVAKSGMGWAVGKIASWFGLPVRIVSLILKLNWGEKPAAKPFGVLETQEDKDWFRRHLRPGRFW